MTRTRHDVAASVLAVVVYKCGLNLITHGATFEVLGDRLPVGELLTRRNVAEHVIRGWFVASASSQQEGQVRTGQRQLCYSVPTPLVGSRFTSTATPGGQLERH
jgi:hypothetical protein